MQTTELGNSGVRVSSIALGALQMGSATSEPESVRILDRFIDAGGTFVDTADMYEWYSKKGSRGGESEEVIGRWMKGRRDKVFLATKGGGLPEYSDDLWLEDGTPNWAVAMKSFPNASGAALTKALEGSLRRLGTDHVDLYFVHVDDRNAALEDTLETLSGFVSSGKVRFIGWSNVRAWRIESIRRLCAANGWPLPVAVELQHTYLRPRGLLGATVLGEEHADYLATHDDMTVLAYSPILKGIYGDPAKRASHPIMANYAGPDTEERLAVLSAVAEEVGVSPNVLVVAWLMGQTAPRVIPLIGPRTYDQFTQLLDALSVKLTAEQLARLDAAGS